MNHRIDHNIDFNNLIKEAEGIPLASKVELVIKNPKAEVTLFSPLGLLLVSCVVVLLSLFAIIDALIVFR